ncbi:topless-related protein [Trifolium repens]|nr:topless-related protein [Trifolium repens]
MAFLSLNQEMMVLVLQFLNEENLKETLHKMEQETGIFFNLKYFEKKVLDGDWDEVEKYLSGFTHINDNAYSTKMYFEIRKQKYYEALDRNDKTRVVEILKNDLKIFATYSEALYQELTNLITLNNLREHIQLSQYQDVISTRVLLMSELKNLINVNNRLNNKLKFPTLSESRLRHLVNQGLNWQHVLCKNPKQSPDIATILTDHTCDLLDREHGIPISAMLPAPPNAGNHPSSAIVPYLSAPVAPRANALPAWMLNGNPSSPSGPLVALTASALPGPSNEANIQRNTRTPITHPPMNDQEIRRLLRDEDIAIARSIENRRNSNDVSKPWKLKEIVHRSQCQRVTMPESLGPSNKVCLLYTKRGTGLLALGSKGVMKMWKSNVTQSNPTEKAATSVDPEDSTLTKGIFMINNVPNNKDAIPCLDISKNNAYGLVACGGIVSLFNMNSSHDYKVMHQFMSPPPAVTCIAFMPQDNNIAAIGREDSMIHIFNIRHGELVAELKGHQKYITSIAFSLRQNIMVSAGADAQLISWNMNQWSMNKSVSIQMPTGENAAPSETKVQFHNDQMMLLACHETQITIYNASNMKPVCQWLPQDELQGCAITSVTYSSNFEQIYATFTDGNIGIFDAGSLVLLCRIASSAYLYQTPSTSQNVYPLVVAANPKKPNQFAIALSDGTIKVFEPNESEKWF